MSELEYSFGSLFIDSGAHTLYNSYVLNKKKVGSHGRELDVKVVWGRGDFSFYSLKKGSEFRKYCDIYASFIKKFQHTGIIFVTVDVISNPALTWEVQKYFEEEHGVQPVPVVHYNTPMEWVDRYIESGKYTLLGVGGLGQGVTRQEYVSWGDKFFSHICPKWNDYMPLIRTHGFAMTSWSLMRRWPWWSVDSATWKKIAGFGWIWVPRWSEKHGWRFDKPPMTIGISYRSPALKTREHYLSMGEEGRRVVDMWLEELGVPLGRVYKGEPVEEGVMTEFFWREVVNLHYIKRLEESFPEWPVPLDPTVVRRGKVKYFSGLLSL